MNATYKQDFLRAGQIAGQVRSFGKSLIKKGASYNEVLAKINQYILETGARPAFPPQIALNHVAAHFLPQPGEDILFNDEVVKLDVGVCYNGAIGDCAVTIDLSGKHQKLIDAVEAALLAAEQSIHVGQTTREIGRIIEKTIQSYGFSPIKNLSGHGLGVYKVHTPPSIPNYDNGSRDIIRPGMTFAIEPFATSGSGYIYESGKPAIFSFLSNRKLRSEAAQLLLEKIKTFDGLPFSSHNLVSKEMPFSTVELALNEMVQSGVLAAYGPLIEETHHLVAQAENSILVDEKGMVFITTRWQ